MNACVIDITVPNAQRDAGSVHTIGVMRALAEIGYRVHFFSVSGTANCELQIRCLNSLGITVVEDYGTLQSVLRECNAPNCMVVVARVTVASVVWDTVRNLAPFAQRVFSVIDVHYVREIRQAQLYGSDDLMQSALAQKKKELTYIMDADAILVTSDLEAEVIRVDAPGKATYVLLLPYAINVVSDEPPRGKDFYSRFGAAFIGGYEHTPNVDAVQYLLEAVIPTARSIGYRDTVLIVGSSMPDQWRSVNIDGVRFIGFVPDLDDMLCSIKLTIAPVRFGGAGLKGKVASSFLGGVPCVMSPLAAEGYGFSKEVHPAIGDSTIELAKCLISLSTNEDLWQQVTIAGYARCKTLLGFEQAVSVMSNIADLPISRC